MKTVIALLVTGMILALQHHLGVRKRKWAGLILPAVMAVLFVIISITEGSGEYILSGICCVAAVWIAWLIGYQKAFKQEKKELDRMKAKDIS